MRGSVVLFLGFVPRRSSWVVEKMRVPRHWQMMRVEREQRGDSSTFRANQRPANTRKESCMPNYDGNLIPAVGGSLGSIRAESQVV